MRTYVSYFDVPNAKMICLMLNNSNVLESSFLEGISTQMANGEIPGLFEGDDYRMLMTKCKEGT